MRRLPTRSALALALLATGGCDWHSHRSLHVVVIGDSKSPFVTGVRLPPAARLIRAASVEGLVALDAEGHIIPALADRWIVTDGGQSYIFRMRDGIWPDGGAITGEAARAALQTAIAGLARTPLGLDLAGVTEVRAMAGRVVEVQLAEPMPDLLQVLAQPELGLVHHGKGAGPMAVKRDGTADLLTPIAPERRGLPAIDGWAETARGIRLHAASGESALASFTAGDADVVLGGTYVDLPRTNRTVIGRYRARLDPVIGLFGLIVTHTDGLLATPDTREAIAMAIDREGLAAALAAAGWTPTTRIVSPGADGDPGLVGERWADITVGSRQVLASQRIAAWVAASHRAAELRFALPQGPGADIVFDRLTADLAKIGIRVSRVGDDQPADLRVIDIVARYPRAAWFLDQLACAADHRPCSAAADALALRARAAAGDPATAATAPALYAQAEEALADSNVFIPLGTPLRWSLTAGDRPGFAVNRWGIHPLMALAMGAK